MTPSEAIEFINSLDHAEIYVVFLVTDLEIAENEIQKLKKMGYASFLRSTAFGHEIVITDKICGTVC